MGELATGKHTKYILQIEKKKDDNIESVLTEHLRINGAYWGLTTLDILGNLKAVEQEAFISWVLNCQHESGGFGGNTGHDPHLLYTLSSIQILSLFSKTHILNIPKLTTYISALQNEDGLFSGDQYGEIDTRFSYLTIYSLTLLKSLDKINVEKALRYIISCKNLDGGSGARLALSHTRGKFFVVWGRLRLRVVCITWIRIYWGGGCVRGK